MPSATRKTKANSGNDGSLAGEAEDCVEDDARDPERGREGQHDGRDEQHRGDERAQQQREDHEDDQQHERDDQRGCRAPTPCAGRARPPSGRRRARRRRRPAPPRGSWGRGRRPAVEYGSSFSGAGSDAPGPACPRAHAATPAHRATARADGVDACRVAATMTSVGALAPAGNAAPAASGPRRTRPRRGTSCTASGPCRRFRGRRQQTSRTQRRCRSRPGAGWAARGRRRAATRRASVGARVADVRDARPAGRQNACGRR